MDFLRDVTNWIAADSLNFVAGIFPLLMLGLLGLYLLWLLIGYLRVSQVGIHDGREARQVVALPSRQAPPSGDAAGSELAVADAPALEEVSGAPYCPVDQLRYPLGATFCTKCEGDLVVDCTNCGATLTAAAASCYRCGTPTGVADSARTR
jgi:ribosomal protein L40E